MAPTSVHLCVILHGLWGSPTHVAYLSESLISHARSTTTHEADGGEATRLEVLVSKVNGISAGHLYDGIDVCAERVVEEIDQEVRRLEEEGATVVKFSMVGYSLGGLVARYVLGLLDSRSPSFFSSAAPKNFTTFASPWIGIPAYDSFWSRTFRYLGGRLLSRTGRQLYERDRFMPLRFAEDGADNKGARGRNQKIEAAPLLTIMADPRYGFYQALRKFDRVDVFANIVNDRTVPFPTGALESHDPFAFARVKAQEAAEKRGEMVRDKIDWRSGGLEITLYDDAPIISSFTRTAPPSSADSSSPPSRRRFRRRLRLPTPFRPSTYPVSRPKALFVISLLPVLWPLSIVFLATRSLVHTAQSSRRIRGARKKVGGGKEGWLERVGIVLAEVAEAAGGDNPEHVVRLEGGGDGEGGSTGVRHENDEKATSMTSESSSTSSTSSSTALLDSPSPSSSQTSASASLSFSPTDSDLSAAALELGTDPTFSASQLSQLRALNTLPQLRKHLVLLDVYFSHGAIVCRDRNFDQHQQGKEVVDWWARHFVL
ncbi:lipid particle protein [Rhodotorula toruloides]|uniref:Lipid particle protein n=1 Tax=Rhodotorula toruloides TaxID=5286 RepID=A0A511KP80_RHOTO|nr:lipid particle protein [Rhodotorula toruloides]